MFSAPKIDEKPRTAGGICLGRKRHVGRPTRRRRTEHEARVEDDRAGDEEPVGQRVEARERHVTRADLQRDDVVREPGPDRNDEQEDHRRPVHREGLVVLLRREERAIGRRELGADA
jgi:hypothetical protein